MSLIENIPGRKPKMYPYRALCMFLAEMQRLTNLYVTRYKRVGTLKAHQAALARGRGDEQRAEEFDAEAAACRLVVEGFQKAVGVLENFVELRLHGVTRPEKMPGRIKGRHNGAPEFKAAYRWKRLNPLSPKWQKIALAKPEENVEP